MTGTGPRRIMLAVLIAGLAGAWGAGRSEAKPGFETSITAALPAEYISDYAHRAKPCPGLVTPPWVSWLTYSNATVGDDWRVYASSTKLCKLARSTANNDIDLVRFDDGAGQDLAKMIAYANVYRGLHSERAPRPAGPKWTCEHMPSWWGQSARDNARFAGHPGSPLPQDFAEASGPAAGAGLCETGAKLDSKARLKGGKFFTWEPDTATCKRHYVLKEIPDPNNPGQTTNPAFPSNLWGDYDLKAC